MPLYTANLAPPEPDSSQPDRDEIRTLNDKDAFAIYRTALAMGMSPPELNSFCDFKFQDETSPMKKWLVARKGNFGQPNEPEVEITWKSMIRLIHKPDCISIAQINAGLPFAMPQRVAIDIPPAYYITAIAIIGTMDEEPELLDTSYVDPNLANCYLAGQLPHNWFNVFELLNIFYRRHLDRK